MEALIAAKLNPVQVKRTSLTKHMHQARVALHAALNGMKPRLMRGKMLQELYKGVDEVKVLEKIKRGLQSEDRIICEELVALHDRKHCQWLEVVKEKRRLARCLENLEQKQHSHDKAEEELARADDPATFLQNAVEAAERMTDRRVKDLTEFLDQKTEGILQSTKYSLDVLSLLLGESMPVPKEVPLVLHLSWDELTREEEDDDFEDGEEVEGGGSEDEEDEDEDEDDESSAPGDEQAAGGDDLAGGGQGDAHARIALEYCIDAASELWRVEKHHLEYEKILKKLGLGAPLHLNTAQCPCYAWPLCLAHTISPGASAHLISVLLLLACYRQGDARGGERER